MSYEVQLIIHCTSYDIFKTIITYRLNTAPIFKANWL